MKVRLLIVDDEQPIREMLERHFTFLGYEVRTAGDGRDALGKLSGWRTDVIVTDLRMPGMDGLELLSEVRRQYPMTPVIILTAYVSMDNALAAWRRGAMTCVFKPLQDLGVLEAAVAQCVQHIQHWSDLLVQLQGLAPEKVA